MEKKQHWKKLDHVAFAFMLPPIVLGLVFVMIGEHDLAGSAFIVLLGLWIVAFVYDLWEAV